MNAVSVCLLMCFCISTIMCVSEEMQEVIDMLHNTCKEQSGAAEDLILKAQKREFTDDPNFKCYVKCIMMEMSTISEEGTGVVDVDAAVAILPPEFQDTLGAAIKKCGTQAGTDLCDTAFKTFKCYSDNSPKDFFLP